MQLPPFYSSIGRLSNSKKQKTQTLRILKLHTYFPLWFWFSPCFLSEEASARQICSDFSRTWKTRRSRWSSWRPALPRRHGWPRRFAWVAVDANVVCFDLYWMIPSTIAYTPCYLQLHSSSTSILTRLFPLEVCLASLSLPGGDPGLLLRGWVEGAQGGSRGGQFSWRLPGLILKIYPLAIIQDLIGAS